jgi:general stress protein 26
MKIEEQITPELKQIADLIENISVAMLTTLDAAGAMVSRPMSPLEMDGAGAIWFFTDVRSTKVEQLAVAHLSFADLEKSTYVSISGRGEIYANHASIERLWTPFAKPWFPDGPESPNLALLKFLPDAAEYWDAPSSKMIRLLAMAASIALAKPIGLGENVTLDLATPLSNAASAASQMPQASAQRNF